MYPEMLCSIITLIGIIILFAAWMGLQDELGKVKKRITALESRYNTLLHSLEKLHLDIEYVKIDEDGKEVPDEIDGIVAAVAVSPPGMN